MFFFLNRCFFGWLFFYSVVVFLDGYFTAGIMKWDPIWGNQTMHCWMVISLRFFSSQCILSVALKGVERIVLRFEGIRKLQHDFRLL